MAWHSSPCPSQIPFDPHGHQLLGLVPDKQPVHLPAFDIEHGHANRFEPVPGRHARLEVTTDIDVRFQKCP